MEKAGWMVWVAIAVGSACGGVLRHLLTETVSRFTGPGFPWGTVLVNASGSLAIGGLVAMAGGGVPTQWELVGRHAAITGVLGGFTTFSAFSTQTVALLQQGQWGAAAVNVVLSVALGLAGCWVGFFSVSALRG